MSNTEPKPLPESVTKSLEGSTPPLTVNRRAFITGGIGLLSGLAAVRGISKETPPVSAEAYDASSEPSPINPPESRDRLVRGFEPTSVSIDPSLQKNTERSTQITNVIISPYMDEMRGLTPEHPYDRIDTLTAKLFAGLLTNTDEYSNIREGGMLSDEELMATPMFQRASSGELPPRISTEDFAQILKENRDTKISVSAYDFDDANPMDTKRTEFKARKGLAVYFMNDLPKTRMYGSDTKIASGFTQKVVDGQLQLGLYRSDINLDPEKAEWPLYWTKSEWIDHSYSRVLSDAIEFLILFGGRTDISSKVGGKYVHDRGDIPDDAVFPDIAELSGGQLVERAPGFWSHDTAPILHVATPSADPLLRSV